MKIKMRSKKNTVVSKEDDEGRTREPNGDRSFSLSRTILYIQDDSPSVLTPFFSLMMRSNFKI